jgi:tetratricopeptide (TPR) repeat protein
MSLLLEALKKAEKAKEEAQRRANSESSGQPTPLQLEGDAPAPKAVLTRDKLPDITKPLEIAADGLAEPSLQPAAAPRVSPQARRADPQSAGRATAKKVFEAKFKESNPRVPFYIVTGALGVFALCTVVYFWYQLRPPPLLVNANPQRSANEASAAAAPPSKPAAPPTAPAAGPTAIPGLPGTSVTQSAPVPRAPAPAAAPAVRPAEQPRLAPRLQPPPRQAAAERATELSVSRAAPVVHPRVESGYAAYLAGDLAAARAAYLQALQEEPANRDAALGLAAVEVRSGRYEAAEALYARLLQSDSRDSHAQAGLIALRGGRSDPLASESRVKNMLAADPGAHVLNFALGNQLAQQGRWPEAQLEYFKAFAAEPDNADFAYNLAVSLDHMRQPKLALEYYRRAISLAGTRGASFDVGSAQSRAEQIAR